MDLNSIQFNVITSYSGAEFWECLKEKGKNFSLAFSNRDEMRRVLRGLCSMHYTSGR